MDVLQYSIPDCYKKCQKSVTVWDIFPGLVVFLGVFFLENLQKIATKIPKCNSPGVSTVYCPAFSHSDVGDYALLTMAPNSRPNSWNIFSFFCSFNNFIIMEDFCQL